MQLKQLRLIGFKTFADKTEIEIDSGMTAVVGPNGSGKSNIVDALLWVLGEQNPRLLRGATSQDVIFSGSDKRKPVGMAEVRLTVDNSDLALATSYTEVAITRRIYRSGESQYLINNSPCRLKDVIELFLDTGMGKGAYSFVSQTEIDAVLSARPEDRRELFEEAAGIKKYRVKKRDAVRKLEHAEANLTRVRDILRELEQQREPMEKQALAARRYLLLEERLHSIEVGLLVAELQKADYELYASNAERDADSNALVACETELAKLEQASVSLSTELAQAEAALESARSESQSAHQDLAKSEARAALLTERVTGSEKSGLALAADIEEASERTKELSAAIEIFRTERQEVDIQESALQTEWAGQKAALSELELAASRGLRQVEEHQSQRLRLVQERASREASLKSANERIVEIKARLSTAEAESDRLLESAAMAAIREIEQNAHRQQLTDRSDLLSADIDNLNLTLEESRSRLSTTRSVLEATRRTAAERSARLNVLTELQDSHEGFYQGVRAVLNAKKRKELTGQFTPVVDLLTVPEKYRVAIEVALGGSLQDIVTLTEGEARDGIDWLKRNRAGRATFLALPLLRPGSRAEAGSHGAVLGSEIVGFASQYQPVIDLLLSRVIIVPDLDEAIARSRKSGGWSKIVTLDGELMTPGGALTGGSLQGRGVHLIGRKGEMDDLRTSLPALQTDIERLTVETETLTTALRETDVTLTSKSKELSNLQAEIAAITAAAIAAEREKVRAGTASEESKTQIARLAASSQELLAEASRLADLLGEGLKENEITDTAISSLSEETQAILAKRDICRSRAVALEVDVALMKEKRESLTRSVASYRQQLGSLEIQLEQKRRQRNASAQESVLAAEEISELARTIEINKVALTQVDDNLAKARDNRQARADASATAATSIREAQARRESITRSLHDSELRLARLEMQVSTACTRLFDEYGISKEEALARPDDTEIDRNTAMEVGRLRRELRGMGVVNTGAAAEYERLTERYEFLMTQTADLEAGRESLLRTIAEIDDSTRGVFMETFEAVKTEFQKLFARLFDGGTTMLTLTDPSDLLETGIDVVAQPPGKKPQHLSLLSGGERALTAVALLFAFVSVKPSPFIILDEVDAPLDGANVEKFTSLVRDFSQNSQFLIITHNPVTMEAAPTWYGVTMKEAGVSSILSYRVPAESTSTELDQTVVLSNPA